MTKDNDVMDGDYIKVDLNYGNAMIDEPIINNYMVKVIAKKGAMTTDSIEAYDGIATAKQNFEKRVYCHLLYLLILKLIYFLQFYQLIKYRKYHLFEYRFHFFLQN